MSGGDEVHEKENHFLAVLSDEVYCDRIVNKIAWHTSDTNIRGIWRQGYFFYICKGKIGTHSYPSNHYIAVAKMKKSRTRRIPASPLDSPNLEIIDQ